MALIGAVLLGLRRPAHVPIEDAVSSSGGPERGPGGRSARRIPRAVSFEPQGDSYTLARDPNDPHYDPSALVMAMNMRAADLFKAEPRDPRWAPALERRIEEVLTNDFSSVFPGQSFGVKSRCASSTCMIEVELPPEISQAERLAAVILPQWASLGTSVEMEASVDKLHFGMTFSKDRHALAEFERSMIEERNGIVRKLQGSDLSKVPDADLRKAHELLTRLTTIEPR